jgi:3-methyladenine DNA glycosylase AlkC
MIEAARRGARSPALVPAEVRAALAAGAPSVNHMEQIALDMGALLTRAFPALVGHADTLRAGGLVTRMRTGGEVLLANLGEASWQIAGASKSDTVRGWGAMAVGAEPGLPLARRLRLIRPFAADPHFAVREWAWLSLRPHVAADPIAVITALAPWSREESPLLRRFASEATRPRGVWSVHLPLLKQEPHHGLPILEPLRADPSRYVQDSVANWLNDASKAAPDWVRETCTRWLIDDDPDPATVRICRRAVRSLQA